MPTLEDLAGALHALSGLVRAGFPLRSSLVEWHRHAPPATSRLLESAARRLQLGYALDVALGPALTAFGAHGDLVLAVLMLHARHGGDVAGMLDACADACVRDVALGESASAAASGAVLSARLVAGLPLFFLPLSLSTTTLLDPLGVGLVGTGAALGSVGFVWMNRLVPRAPRRDDVAWIARMCACVLRGGGNLTAALDAAADHAPVPIRERLEAARRLHGLGLAWEDALRSVDGEGLADVADVLTRGRRLGVPVVDALEGFAEGRHAAARREFEAVLRRAPVKMVLPLTTCILPSFAVLGIGPLLRALAGA